MARLLANLINAVLRPLKVRLLPEWELAVLQSSDPRPHFFLQLARKGFRPQHIIDVGAHKGHWSLEAHRVFPECAFTLIEPQIEMKPHLDRVCSEFKNAIWILAGAGDTNGEQAFTVQHRLDASSFIVTEEQAQKAGLERRNVRVVTLDSVCAESDKPIPEMVKIDAEGFDLTVMRGASKLIGVTEIFLLEATIIEPDRPSLLEIVGYMKDNGYEVYDFTEFIRDPNNETLGAVEIAFARRNSSLRTPWSG